MTPKIMHELIKIFLIENRYEDNFVEFGDKFVIKKHDNTKLIIGPSTEEDYLIEELLKL